MYPLDFKDFKEFLDKENINDQAIITTTPCIVQYVRDGVVKAKVEVVDLKAFKWNEKFGLKSFAKSRNKYWIRGAEWAVNTILPEPLSSVKGCTV